MVIGMVIEFYLVFFERKKVFYNAVCFNLSFDNFLYNNAPITDFWRILIPTP